MLALNKLVDGESNDSWNTAVIDVVPAFVVVVVIVHGSNLIKRGMRVWGSTTSHKNQKQQCKGWHEKATCVGQGESQGWRFKSQKTEM